MRAVTGGFLHGLVTLCRPGRIDRSLKLAATKSVAIKAMIKLVVYKDDGGGAIV